MSPADGVVATGVGADVTEAVGMSEVGVGIAGRVLQLSPGQQYVSQEVMLSFIIAAEQALVLYSAQLAVPCEIREETLLVK